MQVLPVSEKPTYVFTHRELSPATTAVEFADKDVTLFSKKLKQKHEHIWLVGGAKLAQSFLREKEINDLRLFFIPTLLGDGIRLFSGDYNRQRLQLLNTDSDSGGIVEHHYEIID